MLKYQNDFRGGLDLKLSENIKKLNRGKLVSNFDFSGGSLKAVYPFQPLFDGILGDNTLDGQLVGGQNTFRGGRVFFFRKYDYKRKKRADKLVFVDANHQVSYLNLYDDVPQIVCLDLSFTSIPQAINYKLNSVDVMIFDSESDSMVVWDGEHQPLKIIDAPKVSSMCLHGERLFVTTMGDKSELWFSDDLDPSNWSLSLTDAGFIQMADDRGALLKVVSYGGYVYVFRERGITKVFASGGQEGFYLSHLFVSSGRIFDSTICLCGDRICFASSDGIYYFDGSQTRRLLEEVSGGLVFDSTSVGEFFDGKYYVTAKMDFGEGLEKIVLCYSVSTGEYSIFKGLDVEDMTAVVGGEFNALAILTSDGHTYTLSKTSGSGEAFYKTGLYDFGNPSRIKTARKVCAYVSGEGESAIYIYNDRGERVMRRLTSGTNVFPVLLSGKSLGFWITAEAGVEIYDVILEVV